MQRSATAVWQGAIKDGKGNISTQSGVLKEAQYGFNTRFENGPGTNPEELIAAAHAGCFTMALSNELTQAGRKVERLQTTARVTLEKTAEGFSIPAIHLELQASLPDTDQATFDAIANKAKENCPVSKLLNAKITLDAKLNS
jgi:lipoyl-dependent peroxiredoxin